MEQRVTGIGGFFFRSENPKEIKEWYSNHLGLPVDNYGWSFLWRDENGNPGRTQWSPMAQNTPYFNPSKKEFMMNFRVADLEDLLKVLQEEGVEIVGEMETYSYGKFAWIMDPEGNKIELWEPVDSGFGE
jgi:predicted enzyme related to lactoylglutathione lyase